MTPLAQKIAKLACSPSNRVGNDFRAIICGAFWEGNVHCFDVSDISEISRTLFARPGCIDLTARKLAFLPAPVTWIEERINGFGRIGYLLVEDGDVAHLAIAVEHEGVNRVTFGKPLRIDLPLSASTEAGTISIPEDEREHGEAFGAFAGRLVAFLACINTPRVIGRLQHMPHAGLQRALARSRGMVGKFPLQAWTEIKLKVAPPTIDKSQWLEPHETYLTGQKAYHFCRAHLRVRFGQLEFVSSCWRGDPALGIKQSRYKLVPPDMRARPLGGFAA